MVLVKVAVQSSSDTFVDNQIAAANRFGSPAFVLKIATLPKPENLSGHYHKKNKNFKH